MNSKSMKYWSNLQSVAEIDVGRYFEYDSDALKLYSKWLSFLKEGGKKVLEIGSGTGFFTKILLSLFPKIKVVCVEPDPTFTQTLQERFGKKITIIQSDIENLNIKKEVYDAAISHIVLHNLYDPKIALIQMLKFLKPKGKIIAIEPLPASRHYYPNDEISFAFDFLNKTTIFKCTERHKELKTQNTTINPWNNQYAKMFEEVGLIKIQCYGWTSIFTISDSRYDFNERKKWLLMRSELFKKSREENKKILLQAGEDNSEIDKNLDVVHKYYMKLNEASQEELNHIHEQEIVHRIIIVGTKP